MQVLVDKGYEYGSLMVGLGTRSCTKNENRCITVFAYGIERCTCIKKSKLFDGLDKVKDFYFVHSYVVETENEYVLTETTYENKFCSSIQIENIYGVRFIQKKVRKLRAKIDS